jgi:peptidoglycan/LPS O-acetylase OafA/YrhL
MIYRPEIDGLRALAVLPVIFFHAGFELFKGGYIGVDVFFVISGYLITSLLIQDIQSKRFTILNFYERRARRLLPALFVVMFFCIFLSWMWMLPNQMKDFSQSLVAVSFFTSNILFWRETGYFGDEALEKPLLHTWSLSVEEQYYVFFPIFLILAWRSGYNRVMWIIIIIALISFFISEWGWRNKAIANFYLAPTRAWEILAGSVAAFIVHRRGVKENNLLSFIGLLAILLSIFFYDEYTPFPSFYTLLPITGILLIILYSGGSTITTKFLSTKVLVGIGLISYSAYLWHHSLFAFARIRFFQPSETLFLFLSFLSLFLAYFSWKYIEMPFRDENKVLKKQRHVFLSSFIGILFFSSVGLYGHFSNGFADITKTRQDLFHLGQRTEINPGMDIACESYLSFSDRCTNSDKPEVLLWGDSYAMHLFQGINSSSSNLKIRQLTHSACSPIEGLSVYDPKNARGIVWAEKCIDFNKQTLNWLEENPSVKFVIISSSFEWVEGFQVINSDGLQKTSNLELATKHLRETIDTIKEMGIAVVLVSPPPKSKLDIGNCLQHKYTFENNLTCDFEHYKSDPNFKFVEAMEEYINVYWIHDEICFQGNCRSEIDNKFIFRDFSHLSREGSAYLGKKNDWYSQMRNLAMDDFRFFQKERDSSN